MKKSLTHEMKNKTLKKKDLLGLVCKLIIHVQGKSWV